MEGRNAITCRIRIRLQRCVAGHGVVTCIQPRCINRGNVPELLQCAYGPLVVCTGLPESVTFTIRVDVPAVVGVPLTVQPVMLNPAGNVPDVTVQL